MNFAGTIKTAIYDLFKKDFERFYYYKIETMLRIVSIQTFCPKNKEPKILFDKWYIDGGDESLELKESRLSGKVKGKQIQNLIERIDRNNRNLSGNKSQKKYIK